MAMPDKIPLIILEGEVLLPTGFLRVKCGPRTPNWRLAHDVIWNADKSEIPSLFIGVIPSIPNGKDEPNKNSKDKEVNKIGTAARVVKIVRASRNKGRISSYTILLEGLSRIEIRTIAQESPYILAEVAVVDPPPAILGNSDTSDLQNLISEFKAAALRLVGLLKERIPVVAKFQPILDSTTPEKLCDMFVSAIDATFDERLAILNEVELGPRFQAGLQLLKRQLLVLTTAGSLVGKQQRGRKTISLRDELLKQSSNEVLGGADKQNEEEDEDTVARLERRMREADMPEASLKAAKRELKKVKEMERSQNLGPEHQKSVTYVEWLIDLPWSRSTKVHGEPDLALARKSLDNDHYGLEKIKKRIVEYVAVHWLAPKKTATILCLVGPPGVGKTSLGKSIAHTLGREFHRISLGGVHDEADIRGFNRTYVGSQPGRIMQGLKEVKSNDPVLLLDEIDKMSMGRSASTGDPASALLEVLDPAQNHTFVDRYISVPFDLSQVLFVATANSLDSIPAPLLDRMEVIQIPGYTLNEKLEIAKKYIVPRQMTQHGLSDEELLIPKDTLATIGEQYTREAGVRSFERQVAAVCRAAAVKMLENGRLSKSKDEEGETIRKILPGPQIVIKEEALIDILGPPQFELNDNLESRITAPGIAIGLAANALGGSVLFVEATKMAGTGKVQLTGSLGDVIKESAHIALGWLRSHAAALGISFVASSNFMSDTDIHIHFPEGSISKDGPSAGVTLTTALASLLTKRLVRSDTAMTGELTLSGAVLPVGGITAKVLAAYRRGIRRIILPKSNFERNLNEIPADVRNGIEFVPVTQIDEVLQNALVGGFGSLPRVSKI